MTILSDILKLTIIVVMIAGGLLLVKERIHDPVVINSAETGE